MLKMMKEKLKISMASEHLSEVSDPIPWITKIMKLSTFLTNKNNSWKRACVQTVCIFWEEATSACSNLKLVLNQRRFCRSCRISAATAGTAGEKIRRTGAKNARFSSQCMHSAEIRQLRTTASTGPFIGRDSHVDFRIPISGLKRRKMRWFLSDES